MTDYCNTTMLSRVTRAITTGRRVNCGRPRKIRKVESGLTRDAQQPDVDYVVGRVSKCELDTRADTIVAGANCRPLAWTGMKCSVSGFSSEMEAIEDIPVARVATAYTDATGKTWILILNEVLFFGSKLDHSLINPNQIRHYNIMVCDDPRDPFRDLGIDHRKAFIPFETEGACVFFETRVPSDEELETCDYIELTNDEVPWDPEHVELGNGVPDDKNRRYVRQVRTERLARVYTPESDLILGSISEGLVEKVSTERMISQVRISTAEAVTSRTRHSEINPERVQQVFHVGPDKAKHILRVTTQAGIRTAVHPIQRRYRVDHLDLHRRRLRGRWQMDWMTARFKSLNQSKGAYVITNGHFTETYPKETENQINSTAALREFIDDVGVPEKLKTDRAGSFIGRNSDFVRYCTKRGISQSWSEAERSNQIWKADVEIRELKKKWQESKRRRNVPPRLWDWGIKHHAKLMQFLPRQDLDGRTGYEEVVGCTPDISEYLDFEFYDLVWYFKEKHPGVADDARVLGRWLGVSHRVGSDMCYWILTESGQIIADTTVQHVTTEDLRNPAIKEQVDAFTAAVNARLNEENFQLPEIADYGLIDDWDHPIDPAYGDNTTTPNDEDYFGTPEDNNPWNDDGKEADIDNYDPFVGATLKFTQDVNNGGDIATRTARVESRATDLEGRPIGAYNENPTLNSQQYIVRYDDGTTDRYFANAIAENIWAQVDDEGRETFVLKEITDHRFNNKALSSDDAYEIKGNGDKKMKPTTAGAEVEIEWNDGTTDWLSMKEVKASYPVQLAEYAVANKIADMPTYRWWVPQTLKLRNRIINKAKTKYWRTTHKFGIELPKSVKEALALDQKNGNTFWRDALNKEMNRVKVSFKRNTEGYNPDQMRNGEAQEYRSFTEIDCHVVFDVKMNFDRKCRFVANGAHTDAPQAITYSSVVSRDSVRLAFLIAALNDIQISSCDIGNAYLNAPCREKIWFEAGPELGEEEGMAMIVTRALYGLRSSGASWRSMFSSFIINTLGFEPTVADADVYRRKSVKSNGEAYYELLLCYVDDVLLVSDAPDIVMEQIKLEYRLKDDSYGAPKTYLGAEIEKFTIVHDDGQVTEAWSFKSEQYVKNAVSTVEDMLREDGRELKTNWKSRKHSGPLPHTYRPELDVTEELDAHGLSRYQQIIGILRWAVELGRIDILIHVALMSQYSASPREGHLEALYMIIHYLKRHPKKRLVFDPTEPDVDDRYTNKNADWTEFYPDAKEEDPPHMPEPLGVAVSTHCFVDADHAGNKVTRRSHTGILLFVNGALISWFSKKQNTVESATFGSELVALRIARDQIVALRIKLKMFGVPLKGPTNVYCDNRGVVQNTSIPTSTLNKKHNSINYHIVREAAAAGILTVLKENTDTNLADALTKLLPFERLLKLLSFLYDH